MIWCSRMVIWTIKSDPQGIHGLFNLRKQPVTGRESSNQKNSLENVSMKLQRRMKNLTEIVFFDTLRWSLMALIIESIEGWKNVATSFLGKRICHQNLVSDGHNTMTHAASLSAPPRIPSALSVSWELIWTYIGLFLNVNLVFLSNSFTRYSTFLWKFEPRRWSRRKGPILVNDGRDERIY